MSVDFSELDKLSVDLARAPQTLPKYLRQAIEVSARNVKDDARDAVRGRRHFRQAAAAIDYELVGYSGAASGMDAEIGYNKGNSSGRLGNLIEYGAPRSNNSLAPGSELQKALAKNRSDFESGVATAVSDALREVGL